MQPNAKLNSDVHSWSMNLFRGSQFCTKLMPDDQGVGFFIFACPPLRCKVCSPTQRIMRTRGAGGYFHQE
jgi:hypothetical protein